MRPAVIIPTYNEADNIATLTESILALPVDAHVIVVDDNSPDHTGEIVDGMATKDPRVICLHRPTKLGLGTAHIAGMRQALSMGLEPIGTMDADFSHHPRYIPDLLKGLEKFDVMIGSRYVPGGGTRFFSMKRILLSKGANLFARSMLGCKATDCTSGFRAYGRGVLESIDLGRIFSDGYSFLIELLFLCQMRGWSIGESPIVYEDRRAGASKISRKEIYKATYTVMRLFYRRIRGRARTTALRRVSAT